MKATTCDIWLKLDIKREVKHHNIRDKKDEENLTSLETSSLSHGSSIVFCSFDLYKNLLFFPSGSFTNKPKYMFLYYFYQPHSRKKNYTLNLLIDSLHYYSYENIKMQKLESWMRHIQQYISIKSIFYILRLQIHYIGKAFPVKWQETIAGILQYHSIWILYKNWNSILKTKFI